MKTPQPPNFTNEQARAEQRSPLAVKAVSVPVTVA